MRSLRNLCAVLWLGLTAATGFAVEVTLRGPVGAVNPRAATLTLNTQPNARTIAVAPTAAITINGKAARLEEIPTGGEAIVIADKDTAGTLRATQITVSRSTPAAPAASPLLEGSVVGIDPAAGTLTVRTAATDLQVVAGTAPVMIGDQRVPLARIRVGDTVRVRRTLPPGGTDAVTDMIWITTAPGGPGAATPGTSPGQAGPDPGSTGVSLAPLPAETAPDGGAAGAASPRPLSQPAPLDGTVRSAPMSPARIQPGPSATGTSAGGRGATKSPRSRPKKAR
jgi:hypothetical protein